MFLCSIAIALLASASLARAADPDRCHGLSRRFEIAQPQISAMEVSLTLFSAVDVTCGDLLAHGADARAPDETDKPPIVYAAAGARLDIVKRLLAQNIDINARYRNDLSLLMWASGPDEKAPEAQAIEIVSYLLDAGAHTDDRDDRGRTALMIAAEGGHAEIASLLLARGADPSLRAKAGKRAADLTALSSLRERLTRPA